MYKVAVLPTLLCENEIKAKDINRIKAVEMRYLKAVTAALDWITLGMKVAGRKCSLK
jgi:hypothetical protein